MLVPWCHTKLGQTLATALLLLLCLFDYRLKFVVLVHTAASAAPSLLLLPLFFFRCFFCCSLFYFLCPFKLATFSINFKSCVCMSDGFKGVESLKNSSRTYTAERERERVAFQVQSCPAAVPPPRDNGALQCIALSCHGLSNGNQSTPLMPKRNFNWSWALGLPLRCGQCARCASNHEQLAHCLPLAALREKIVKNLWLSLYTSTMKMFKKGYTNCVQMKEAWQTP